MKVYLSGILIFLISITLLPSDVLGDSSDNDTYITAEIMDEDFWEGSLDLENDNIDWYMIEVPPNSEVEITVRLTTAGGEIIVDAKLDGDVDEHDIYMDLDPAISEETDTFSNDEAIFVDLYLSLQGHGEYQVEIYYKTDVFGGCCISSYALLSIPLIASIGVIVVIRRRKFDSLERSK